MEYNAVNTDPRAFFVIAVDPGMTTGISIIAVPWESVFGKARGAITGHFTYEITGDENEQVNHICRLIFNLTGIGEHPALAVLEDFDMGRQETTGAASDSDMIAPVRINAKIDYKASQGQTGSAVIIYQMPSLAKSSADDDRLEAWGLYDAVGPNARDATRHGIVALRRVKSNLRLREEIGLRG